MSLLPSWNPVTIKRWRRFRRLRRAWWSLCILLALYLASLGAELLCNNQPLYVRFEGRSYFPVVRYYPEDLFLRNGKQTRPDYKRLRAAPAFATNPANAIVFAPIPFGPYEIIDPASLPVDETVTLALRPHLRLGTVNIRPDFTIARSADAGSFFGIDEEKDRKSVV